MRKIQIIAGPTASGKTAYAINKALEIGGEIVNCDSLQVYKDLKILTAYPTPDELSMVNHRAFGYLEYNEKTTSVDWAKVVSNEIEEIFQNGKIPVIVGGTGLYINSLVNGISPLPEVSERNREISTNFAKEDFEELCKKVYELDPELINLILPENHRQMIRAYEIFLETGKSIRYFYSLPKIKFIDNVDFEITVIDIDRNKLYEKINLRFDMMLENGAIEEVEELLNIINNPDKDEIFKNYPIFKAIGSKEIAKYLDGDISYEKMKELSKTASRQYAKRQITWFKHQVPKISNILN